MLSPHFTTSVGALPAPRRHFNLDPSLRFIANSLKLPPLLDGCEFCFSNWTVHPLQPCTDFVTDRRSTSTNPDSTHPTAGIVWVWSLWVLRSKQLSKTALANTTFCMEVRNT